MYIIPLAFFGFVAISFVLLPYYKIRYVSPTEAPDVGVYRSQLKELENDVQRGIIAPDEAAKTRTEIERRLLKAASQQIKDITIENPNHLLATAMVAILLMSGFFYAVIGSPAMPDFPKNSAMQNGEKIVESEEVKRNKILAGQVKLKLQEMPDEARGWAYLSNLEMSLGNFQAASQALYQAHILEPDTFDYQLMYAESLILASAERVTPAAMTVLNKAVKLSPDHPGPKYYLALADFQAGDVEIAYEDWSEIRNGLEENNPLLPLVDFWIGRAETALGIAAQQLPETRAPSISAEQAEIIQNMGEAEQQELIRQMVMQLAEKQRENPTNIEGWLRLSRAYIVLGQKDQAIEAMKSALLNAPADQKEILQKEVEKLTNLP